MKFEILKHQVGQFLSNNTSTILTAGGVVGAVTTAVLTGRASYKAADIIRDRELKHVVEVDGHTMGLTKKEKAALVWSLYIPPVVVGTATVGSIVAANMMSAKRAAALAAAYGISERQLKEYKEKLQEKLTPGKYQAAKDEIAQQRVNDNPPVREVIIMAGGDVLCYDMLTGRYFRSTVEQIKKAESKINADLVNHQYASLSSFYDEIGLPATGYTDTVGWNAVTQDIPIEVQLSTTTSPDQKPCIAIDFSIAPVPEYARTY